MKSMHGDGSLYIVHMLVSPFIPAMDFSGFFLQIRGLHETAGPKRLARI